MKLFHAARLAVVVLAVAAASCGSVREGTGTSFLIVDNLEFARGDDPDTFAGNAISDVETVVDDVPTTFNDVARVTLRLGMKDPGPAASPTQPTQNQAITVNRYHVRFFRADGRNTQGVDVPHEFDGAFTATVSGGTTQPVFTIVRNIAKDEAPLAALKRNGIIITIFAEVTFYGQDQTGHEASATARLSIDFGNFADKED
jgi:hypothetical protein